VTKRIKVPLAKPIMCDHYPTSKRKKGAAIATPFYQYVAMI